MKIHDLIFKELLKRGYKLEGKTKVWDVADSKLWYLTPEQAQGFLDLEEDEYYEKSIIEKEISLIKKNLPEIIKILPFKSYNLVDLGCGDGRKAVVFISELKKHFNLRYCPVDISSYMVNKAAQSAVNENLLEAIKTYKEKGFKIYIFTDTTKPCLEEVHRPLLAELVDDIFASCELGILKKDTEFFRIVSEKTGYKPKEILFFDDSGIANNTYRPGGFIGCLSSVYFGYYLGNIALFC